MSTWREFVQRGLEAKNRLGQAKFDLGDLADEVETTYDGGQLQAFAHDIDVDYRQLCNYRSVARAFSSMNENRGKAPWTVYKLLAGREDRYDILAERDYWTVNAMHERLGRPPQGYRTTDPEHVDHSLQNLTIPERAKLVGDALQDPEVASEVSEQITTYVASDHGRVADVMAKRGEHAGPHRMVEPREQQEVPKGQRDYDAMVEMGVNSLLVALVAERNGQWSPSATSASLLYFLPQLLANRHAPDGNREELVSDELSDMFEQLESYANQGGSDGRL